MSIKPRKRFGQHFLCDEFIIAKIIAALQPKSDEHLIEIGGGRGALTFPILQAIHHLTVIEIDRDLARDLAAAAPKESTLTLLTQDVLTVDFNRLKKDERFLRIFGNLPYNITTPLIFHLLQFAPIIKDMLFMVQKEVAVRLAAHTDSKNYGRLSVMTQYHAEVELLFDVPPTAFLPRPKVASSMVRLTPRAHYPAHAKNQHLFEHVVKLAFGERRKKVHNALKSLIPNELWAQIPIDHHRRPENLSVADFVAISNVVANYKDLS